MVVFKNFNNFAKIFLGEYHHHVNPTCLYSYSDSSKHSPIIGFTFDSFPVYGPFGYSDPKNSNSPIKRMMTSYRLRNITVRQTLSDGTSLTSTNYGPEIGASYPLGCFIQDYEFVEGLGDLGYIFFINFILKC